MKITQWMMSIMILAGLLSTPAYADEVSDTVLELQHQWASANYKAADDTKEATFKALVAKAEALSAKHADRAEPKIWEAIIRAGYAGAMGGLSSITNAMPQMEKGRDLLLEAEKIDANALNGSVYTTLGSFFYMTPGWPIGFGDEDKALEYLSKAQTIAPDDMDANYFMADYWVEQRKYKKALPLLEKVMALPAVANRPVYSTGRKTEAAVLLAKVKKKLHLKVAK
ncbi:lipopolysaccharide assembly protein LapB [Mariprofundus sp. EBB-1]|uniref:tetratricopeptide repeat protein n=1 Tax=Mariprofundus sp. EBB-1 TaxID=2650971 RepID=UPI001F3D237B|nr:hypothetical protein [Mariprofundus sp. EBB-1]